MIFNDLYSTCAQFVCFDGIDGLGDGTGDGLGDGGQSGQGGSILTNDNKRTFTQDELNKILADDRRKHQTTLLKTEETYKELLTNNQSLTAKERQTLEENLAAVQGKLRTKEHQYALDMKQLEDSFTGKLTAAEKDAKDWQTRYREETVNRNLLDAAIAGDAFNPNLIVVQLRQMAKLIEVVDEQQKGTGTYTTVIEFPDVDPTTGKATILNRTPEEAVKRMKELPDLYGGLFKSNVVSGIGSNSITAGLAAGSNGKFDVRALTPEQYQKVRAEHPELLGLTKRRRR